MQARNIKQNKQKTEESPRTPKITRGFWVLQGRRERQRQRDTERDRDTHTQRWKRESPRRLQAEGALPATRASR